MKLITKASRIFLLTCLVAMAFSTLLGIVLFQRIMSHEIDEQLVTQKNKIETYVVVNQQLPKNELALSDSLSFTLLPASERVQTSDTLLYDGNEWLTYRRMQFPVKVGNRYYRATLLKPMYETEDLTEAIVYTLAAIVFIILSALFVVNYFVSRRLWQPFYETLSELKTFKVSKNSPLKFKPTTTSEFRQLQEDLSALTEKVRSDYQALKTFTENASHELQTPLSVIGSNLEMLIQEENLNENQLQQISQLIDELGKVAKLNQTLLLLTKIENRQFEAVEKVNLSALIQQKLTLLDVWIQHKNIRLETEIAPQIFIEMNPHLLDVLLNNLFSNAIKHNVENGKIKLKITDKSLIVSNSGKMITKSTTELFERFQKETAGTDSHGLGLSMVQQICETYHFGVSYHAENGWHSLKIDFS